MMDILATPPTNSAPRLLHLAIGAIDTPAAGVRRAAVDPAQDAGLRQSVATLGVIQPIAVRAHPDDPARRVLITGRRRLAAALAAGHGTIAVADHGAIDDAEALAIETAENLQRVALAPLDQWRAIRRHVEVGWSLDAAAEALGLSQRATRRLEKLAGMAPEILAAVEALGMPPDEDDFRDIVAATHDRQRQALSRAQGEWGLDEGDMVDGDDLRDFWNLVANYCEQARIPRDRAIFDVAAVGVVFEEDLFAEPDGETWFAADVAGFLAAQRAALEAKAAASKGRIVAADPNAVPRGFSRDWSYTWGEKPPKGCTIYATVHRDGRIDAAAFAPPVAAATQSPSPISRGSGPEGTEGGAGADDPADEVDDSDDEVDDSAGAVDTPAPPAALPKPRFTEAGRILLGARKTDAIRAALRDRPAPSAEDLLMILLLALAGGNISVRGVEPRLEGRSFADLAAVAWAARDQPGAGHRLRRLAAEAAARMLRCGPTAQKNASYGADHSGAAAEWVGMLLEAERDLPRLDDAALLGTAGNEALAAACHAAGLSEKGTGKAMRAALQDRAEHVILFEEAKFHAPPPSLDALDPPSPRSAQPCAQAVGADACERCWWKRSDGDQADPCEEGEWIAQLARLGLTPADLAEDADGVLRLVARGPDAPAPPAPPRATEPPPPGAFDCGWTGAAVCREDGTHRCLQMCPRHEKYVAWLATQAGQAARRAADNEAAKRSLRRPRGKKASPEGTPA